MRFLFTSYARSAEYTEPESWLKRIEGYTGIPEALAKWHEVICIEHISYNGMLYRNGVSYHFINAGKDFHRTPGKFHRMIKQFQPDVVFINGFNYPAQIILLKLALGRNIKIIVLHRAERPFTGLRKFLQKLADRCVNVYLFTSMEFASEWEKNLNTNKIHEVIQASSVFKTTDKSTARKSLDICSSTLLFLWVGSLIERKDPVTVVKAFLSFRRENGNAQLYMIFQSPDLLPEIITLLDAEKAQDGVVLVGKIAHEELGNWYNAADFIIAGSHHEGSGVAVAEAMSCGCIPVVTDIPSFRRMTGPGKCGLLFKAGDADGLTEKLKATLKMDMQKEQVKSLQQFQSELSFEAIANKINSITGYQHE